MTPEHPVNDRVSVIIPTLDIVRHGRVDMFRQLLHSLHTQTYGRERLEIIIVDGNSEDGTKDILESLKAKKEVDIILQQKGLGIYSAFNQGAKQATGNYLNFASSDDYFSSGAVQNTITAMVKGKADLGHGQTEYLLETGDLWYTSGSDPEWHQIFFGMPIGHQSLFVRLNYFERQGPYREDYDLLSDYVFLLDSFKNKAQIAYTDQITAHHRFFGGASSTNKKVFDEFEMEHEVTAKYLGLSHHAFNQFLLKANPFVANGIGVTLDPNFYSQGLPLALRQLSESVDLTRSNLFIKGILVCIFRNTDFPQEKPTKNDALLGFLSTYEDLSPNHRPILLNFPFVPRNKISTHIATHSFSHIVKQDNQVWANQVLSILLTRMWNSLDTMTGR